MPCPRPAAVAVLLALAACATAPAGSPMPMTEVPGAAPRTAGFQATGELLYSGGGSAGYNPWQVIGPNVNLAYQGDGKWVGNLDGRDVWLTATAGRISGPNVSLVVLQEGDRVTLRGTWFRRNVSLVVSANALTGRTGDMGPSFDFTRASPGLWAGVTPRGRAGLEARGDAQQFPNVLMPQFALALLAALP